MCTIKTPAPPSRALSLYTTTSTTNTTTRLSLSTTTRLSLSTITRLSLSLSLLLSLLLLLLCSTHVQGHSPSHSRYPYSREAEGLCRGNFWLKWLKVESSRPQSDLRTCLAEGNAAYLNIVILESPKSYNLNHHFQEQLWPVTAYIAECLAPLYPLFCSLGQIPKDHFYRTPGKEGRAFLIKSFLQDVCQTTDWDNDIRVVNPDCYVTISLREHGMQERMLLGAPKKEDRGGVFQRYKRGAQALLLLNSSSRPLHFDLEPGYQRIILIYSRMGDGKHGRALQNPDHLAAQLRAAFPSYSVVLVPNLTRLSQLQQFLLFDACSVLIAPHGGWAPNLMFMNEERAFYPRLVITLEKAWLPEARPSFDTWDKNFCTWKLDVMFGTKFSRFKDKEEKPYGHSDTLYLPSMQTSNSSTGDFTLGEAQELVRVIRRQFSPEVQCLQFTRHSLYHEEEQG